MTAQSIENKAIPRRAAEASPNHTEEALTPFAGDADSGLVEADPRSTTGLVELLLKDPDRIDAINRQENVTPALIPRFLAIGLASYLLFSVAMIVILADAKK